MAFSHLQFDVVSHRLKIEYGVDATTRNLHFFSARWITCEDPGTLERFKASMSNSLALDASGSLTFLASSKPNLDLTMDRWPKIKFHTTREHSRKVI